MNERTLVVIHGYSGDADQIRTLMPAYEHHQAPIVVMSPEDSPILRMDPHICRTGGKRCYIGQDCIERQLSHMKMALEYEEFDWFLFNDSDSFLLTPKIPEFLYTNQSIVWSNIVDDFRKPGIEDMGSPGVILPDDFHDGYPLIALHPPWFMSRRVLEKVIKYWPKKACPWTPMIDWSFVEACVNAGIEMRRLPGNLSIPTNTEELCNQMVDAVKGGAVAIHSVKTKPVLDRIMEAYENTRHGK